MSGPKPDTLKRIVGKVLLQCNQQSDTEDVNDKKSMSVVDSWITKYKLKNKYDVEYFHESSNRCFSIYRKDNDGKRKLVTFYQSEDCSKVKIHNHEKGYTTHLNLKGRLQYLYKNTPAPLHALLSLFTIGSIPKESVSMAQRDYGDLEDRILKLISPESNYRYLGNPEENNHFFDKILSESVVKKYITLEDKKDDGSPRNPVTFLAYQSNHHLCKGKFILSISEVNKTYFTYTLTWNDTVLSNDEPLTQMVLSEVLDLIFDRQYSIDE